VKAKITSAIAAVGPLIDDTEFPYFVGIVCEIGNGEYASSASLRGCTFDANSVLGNELG